MSTFSLRHYNVDSTAVEKAVKDNKAEVPIHLWDFRIAFLLGAKELTSSQIKAVELLWSVILRRWKQNVLNSWREWWNHNRGRLQEYNPTYFDLIWSRGVKACDHALQATSWEWPKGSGVFFWRWPPEFLLDLSIGVAPLWINTFSGKVTKQGRLGDQHMREKIAEILEDIRTKGYITPGFCKTTMNFFAVPKGESDIRMVYDGTKSGLSLRSVVSPP